VTRVQKRPGATPRAPSGVAMQLRSGTTPNHLHVNAPLASSCHCQLVCAGHRFLTDAVSQIMERAMTIGTTTETQGAARALTQLLTIAMALMESQGFVSATVGM